MDRIKSLEVFRAVVEHKGFTRCADALKMPKSVVTRHVQELEAEMGTRLLVRNTRRLTPTAVGECVLERAATIVASYQAMTSMCKQNEDEACGRIRLDIPCLMDAEHVRRALCGFTDSHSNVRIDLRIADSGLETPNDLADVFICVGASVPQSFVARRLTSLPIGLYASPQFVKRRRSSSQAASVNLEEVLHLDHPAILAAWQQVDPATANKFELSRHASFSANHPSLVVDAAAQGAGVALIPCSAARAAEAHGLLLPVFRGRWPAPLDVHLLYRSRNEPLRVRKLIDHLVSALSEELSPSSQGDVTRRVDREMMKNRLWAA